MPDGPPDTASAHERARIQAMEAFARSGATSPSVLVRAPGRVNVLGEHTDYNDGLCLPVAIDREILVAGATAPTASGRPVLHVASFAHDEVAHVRVARDHRGMLLPDGATSWERLTIAVVDEVERATDGRLDRDVFIGVGSSLPEGAGLSSSAAFEVGIALTVSTLFGWTIPADTMIAACRTAEHRGLGVPCGPLDQTTVVLAAADSALLLDFATRATSLVALPPGTGLIVCDSGVPRTLAGSGYARRLEECARACRLLGVGTLRDVVPDRLEEAMQRLGTPLDRRVRHVVTENERVLEAVHAGDVATLGNLVHASHVSLRDDYEVSVPEADRLVEIAESVDGVEGARIVGAGFGGSVLAVAEATAAPRAAEEIRRLAPQSRALTVSPAAGAHTIPPD